MSTIPFLKVSGSHFECGVQIGQFFKEKIKKYIEVCRMDPPEKYSWEECLKFTPSYLAPTQKYFPEIIEEVKGTAEGAGVNFIELFASGIEEFYSKHHHIKECTDIISLPPASNHALVAHNNDLPPSFFDYITQVEWNFSDGTQMYTVGLAGFLVSVGVNSSPLVLTGNEVTPNDVKVGIPRAYIARAILLAQDYDSAVQIATHPERASSYNNIITVADKAVSAEASATDFELIQPKEGILVHSNHYCSVKMKPYEGHPGYDSSITRLESGLGLSTKATRPITIETLKSFLRDHGMANEKSDNTICRHGQTSASIFGFTADFETGVVELAAGSPCENKFEVVWNFLRK
jgi:isopenicillin-N N-acyltransferase-like protein